MTRLPKAPPFQFMPERTTTILRADIGKFVRAIAVAGIKPE